MYTVVPSARPTSREPVVESCGIGSPRAMPKSARTRVALSREEHVLRLDVAMDDPFAVRVGERVGHAARELDRLVDGSRRRVRAGRATTRRRCTA